ncbi:hypothetical protein [Clostridium luticellarii]|jgi:hypothetical protein|uniref:Uncharacterized protein n=1 Tax=Clostridium luticellarii TaxID=1691940 RepID=A0A2T0BNY8_9CLOT|nr:hypothetical protein [Clostridium luticellarii]PRR85565.1 hypothetical protein CLLU_14860 [Clostridium luticellarii]
MEYWGNIDGIEIYEDNPEKKQAAIERGFTLLARDRIKKIKEGIKTDEKTA